MKSSGKKFFIFCLFLSCVMFLFSCSGHKKDNAPSPRPSATPTLEVTAPIEIEPEIVTYAISFVGNGGSKCPENTEKVQNEPFVIPEDIPVRKCYTFTGWYTYENPETLYFPGDAYYGEQNTEFLASWKLSESTDDPELGANWIPLSGNREDIFVTDKYYYYEGDEFFVYFDKDLKIPGDFCDNISLIMNQLELETGMSYDYPVRVPSMTTSSSFFGAKDPWRYFSVGKKVLIYVLADRENAGYISSASTSGRDLLLFLYDLFSDEVWNSIPEYRNHPEKLYGYIPYCDVVHELTHTLTNRYHCGVTRIVVEGSADYYTERVMRALKDHSADFQKSFEYFENLYKSTKIAKKITPETAEDIFISDFSDVDSAYRGDEYTFGRMLFEFITERYGETFLKDFLVGASERGLRSEYTYDVPWVHEPERHAELIKDLAGEDVFTEFGKWYQDGLYSK